MTGGDGCAGMRLLVQADADGELGPAEAARVGAHLEGCPACVGRCLIIRRRRRCARRCGRASLLLPRQRGTSQQRGHPPTAAGRRRPSWRHRLPRLRWGPAAPFGAGFVLAACLALALVLPRAAGELPDAVVASHIRTLQPGPPGGRGVHRPAYGQALVRWPAGLPRRPAGRSLGVPAPPARRRAVRLAGRRPPRPRPRCRQPQRLQFPALEPGRHGVLGGVRPQRAGVGRLWQAG